MGVAGSVLVARWSWGLLRDTSRVLLDHQEDEGLRRAITQALEKTQEIASPISTCGASVPICMR